MIIYLVDIRVFPGLFHDKISLLVFKENLSAIVQGSQSAGVQLGIADECYKEPFMEYL